MNSAANSRIIRFNPLNWHRRFSAAVLWLSIIALFANQANVWASPPKVVITIKPIHSLASGVMYGVSDPILLIKGSASPHSYSLRPSDARTLQEADLIVWVGAPLEMFLKKSLASLGRRAKVLTLLDQNNIVSTVLRRQNQQSLKPFADETERQNRVYSHATHSLVDPHIWLDPLNAIEIVKIIAAALSILDASNRENYERNSRQFIRELAELHTTLKRQLKPITKKPYMVYHDAYRLFENRYGLNSLGAVTNGPDRQPGVKRLHQVRELLVKTGASCVFSEPQIEPKWLKSILPGSSAKSASLDPIGVNLKPGRRAYFDLMHGLSQSLISCLLDVPLNGRSP